MKRKNPKVKNRNIDLDDFIKEKFNTKAKRKSLEREYRLTGIALSIAELRRKQGLSQKELAKRLHTKQQCISRIEQPENENITIGTLDKIAEVFHKKLSVKFE